jgi:hypothetical protein
MSKSTLRKRIALTATTALFAGMLSVVSAPVASANLHSGTVGTSTANPVLSAAAGDTTTYVATTQNTGGAAVRATIGTGGALADISVLARSTRLLAKDTSTGVAQTATVTAGGVLSIYGVSTTTTSFVTTGGTLSSATSTGAASAAYADPASAVLFTNTAFTQPATGIAALWTLPTTAGTYTFTKYFANGSATPNATTGLAQGTLGGQITVTVVAASAGGAYNSANSVCYAKTTTAVTTVDSTSSFVTNGNSWYVGFSLKDAYSADLASGNLIVTASTGSVVNIGADGSALAAGTATTAVLAASGSAHQVRVDQATAGAPVTSTITVSYNGTTVCTKTVKIAGVASTVTVSKVATGDIGTTTVNAEWLSDPAGIGTGGARSGHYYVQLKDSAGNIVTPASAGEFSMDPATTTTTVTALAVNAFVATSTSSTSSYSSSVGTFTCGPVAGSSDVKLRHTSAATGVTISSPAFTARCADNPYTYTVSMDKASYSQGEIGTMTVSFLDSKGFKANSVTTTGGSSMILPMLTVVTATGSATALTDANGEIKYTFTVGTASGMSAGTFSGIVDFTALTAVAAVKATPTYKLSTGGDTTTNADVLKSIVALIASINKQIQALQKLILKR